jgi:hypothetical protein
MSDLTRLNAGVLIIGSLLWDKGRQAWRDARLDVSSTQTATAPIRYGRLSGAQRGYTYTMVFSRLSQMGHAKVVRYSRTISTVEDLIAEFLRLAAERRKRIAKNALSTAMGAVFVPISILFVPTGNPLVSFYMAILGFSLYYGWSGILWTWDRTWPFLRWVCCWVWDTIKWIWYVVSLMPAWASWASRKLRSWIRMDPPEVRRDIGYFLLRPLWHEAWRNRSRSYALSDFTRWTKPHHFAEHTVVLLLSCGVLYFWPASVAFVVWRHSLLPLRIILLLSCSLLYVLPASVLIVHRWYSLLQEHARRRRYGG